MRHTASAAMLLFLLLGVQAKGAETARTPRWSVVSLGVIRRSALRLRALTAPRAIFGHGWKSLFLKRTE